MEVLVRLMRNYVYAFWICMLLHLIADYTLQGCLANLKQKAWWKENVPCSSDWRLYRYDYIAGLLCHSLMWSLVTYLPLILVTTPIGFSVVIVLNTLVHARIDHLKANKLTIDLCQDQTAHVIQLIATLVPVYACL